MLVASSSGGAARRPTRVIFAKEDARSLVEKARDMGRARRMKRELDMFERVENWLMLVDLAL